MTLAAARDISIIILIVPTCLCALLPAALVFGSWWVMRRVNRGVPPRLRSVRGGIRRTRDAIDGMTRVATRPIFFGETQSARLRAMWRAVLRPFRERQT
ncbi:MAG TPA: hypothetical protein VIK33_00625 [Anaerolineae bacterium]